MMYFRCPELTDLFSVSKEHTCHSTMRVEGNSKLSVRAVRS